jgi:hypothetical protein
MGSVTTLTETAGCDDARPVVWEDGGSQTTSPSYPIWQMPFVVVSFSHMKILYLVLLAFGIAGCGSSNGNSAQPDGGICCAANPSEMIFKTSTGKEVVSWDEVTTVEVNLLPTQGPSAQPGLDRLFTGDQAKLVVRQLKFGRPKQVGFPASMETGIVTIRYAHTGSTKEQARTISIQNDRLLEDKNFPDVTYDPGITLDRKWLASQ